MAEKRKDKKGRILKTGESQRSDGTYQYRYKDPAGKLRYVYAPTLTTLREKEDGIQRDLMDGIDYSGGEVTVAELAERYAKMKRDLSPNSQRAYGTALKRIKKSTFGQKIIKTVRKSDAMAFYVTLHDEGMRRNTIIIYQNILRPAFEMAVEDDLIRKNPFRFKLSDILPDDAEKRTSLTKEQQETYLQYAQMYRPGSYFDEILVLLHTGLRVSELYGLTDEDVDFKKHCIHVRKQLCRTADQPYFIKPPKTASGTRSVPLDDITSLALKRVLNGRPALQKEPTVDGYANFIFLDKDNHPKVSMHLENHMRKLQKWIHQNHDATFPRVTPHVLRHTFCTNLQQAGLDVKSLQYLLGHSDVSVTLNVYSHMDFESVQQAFNHVAANF